MQNLGVMVLILSLMDAKSKATDNQKHMFLLGHLVCFVVSIAVMTTVLRKLAAKRREEGEAVITELAIEITISRWNVMVELGAWTISMDRIAEDTGYSCRGHRV
jgi:hypothetical protein